MKHDFLRKVIKTIKFIVAVSIMFTNDGIFNVHPLDTKDYNNTWSCRILNLTYSIVVLSSSITL